MLRKKYLRRLTNASPIELYLSGTDGARMYWPWRMQPAHRVSASIRSAGKHYIVDSAPQAPSVDTTEVLDAAVKVDADAASLQDVYKDHDATVSSLLRGLEIADSHSFDGKLLLPLQAPHTECYREIGSPTEHMIGIGGMKGASPAARIAAAKELRALAPNAHIHGFGWGVRGGLAQEIRNKPTLLDSVDYSTLIKRGIERDMTPGAERMSVQAAFAAYRLVRDLREVTPFVTASDNTTSQGALNDF